MFTTQFCSLLLLYINGPMCGMITTSFDRHKLVDCIWVVAMYVLHVDILSCCANSIVFAVILAQVNSVFLVLVLRSIYISRSSQDSRNKKGQKRHSLAKYRVFRYCGRHD